MEELIDSIRRRLGDGAYSNEAAVSISIVLPILRALGWDDSDPDQIRPEYSTGQGRVDYALCTAAARPAVFVEVKGVGRSDVGDRQLFEYAFHQGVPLCVLTDGRDWSFCLPSGQGAYDERRLHRLQLAERSTAESIRILQRYLARPRVKSGDAIDDAMRDYRDLASRRDAARALPAAWAQLLAGPEDLLLELLGDQAEAITGFRPATGEIMSFLSALVPTVSATEVAPKPRAVSLAPPGRTEARTVALAPVPISRSRSAPSGAAREPINYRLFGSAKTALTAAAAFVDMLIEIARRRPDSLPAIAAAARARQRNHIARTVAEIYPKRPDLAKAVEIAPGWLVGLNIANREKIRILQAACRASGFGFGSDVEIELPNANA